MKPLLFTVILYLNFEFNFALEFVVPRRRRAPESTALTHADRLLFLKLHNDFRSKVQPAASNMRRMYYSLELEENAQWLVNSCKFGHAKAPFMTEGRYKNQGQNILYEPEMNNATIRYCAASWHEEYKDYRYGKYPDHCSNMCGHYTAMVWAETYLLGCAKKRCEKMAQGYPAWYYVCHYYPHPNYYGKFPYEQGTPCSKCPADMPKCENNLCGFAQPSCDKIETGCLVKDPGTCICVDDMKAYSSTTGISNFYQLMMLIIYFFF